MSISGPVQTERDLSVRGWLTYIAEASDLLAGTLDEDQVIALTAQLMVPRLAVWCAVYTADEQGGPCLGLVWHTDEEQAEPLRRVLDGAGPPSLSAGPTPWHLGGGQTLQAYVFPLAARGRRIGALVIAGARLSTDAIELAEELSRRAALALDNARLYAAQTATSRALQRSLLPSDLPDIPGVEIAVVFEPAGEGSEVGGDFYDVFEVPDQDGERRWRFAVGDVCGTGPEAAAVTGLARHALRILGAEGMPVPDVLGRLNRLILAEGDRGRLLTLLHAEISPGAAGTPGVRVGLVTAGHPSPLVLHQDGTVVEVASPQPLLGAFEEAVYGWDLTGLDLGDVVLCFTDGVTERRDGRRMLGDGGGLERLLAGCTGLSAGAVATRIQQAVRDFAAAPSYDDVAILVLRIC